MTEEELKLVLAAYQQKTFELFNKNIVYEVQINTLSRRVEELLKENESLKSKPKRSQSKTQTEDFT
jgi:hypothetical protein